MANKETALCVGFILEFWRLRKNVEEAQPIMYVYVYIYGLQFSSKLKVFACVR